MRNRNFYNTFLFCLTPFLLLAQRIDNTTSFRNINSDKYFRFHYDNDYFTATDIYYTQGISLELVSPALKKNPLTKTLLYFKNNSRKFGLSIEQNGYTPTNISSDEILYGDRPFSANIMLKTFSISMDTALSRRLSTTLSLGIIGQGAFGKEEQTAIHRKLKNVLPHGWQHQIQNDIVINYTINYEKQLYHYKNIFYLNSNAQLHLGTLSDKASVGFTTIIGKTINPFKQFVEANKCQFYLYNQPLLSAVAYDATLQGGLFNKKSPYTIKNSELSRITLQDNFGAVLTYKRVYLEYYQSILTKEFETGRFHRWGGVRIGFILK